ncbi:hypothetical protein DdX_12061 [Ditylenchus destructor]|uniref:C2H2-type domain-containing protein n=1 Tax=Ditylenchus destructor TaxID=166010 RepID=A0AAD4QXP3_9BILA|nr:hypothetical protein DdX_12061 [Ditylenchus destructor]
MTSQLDLICSLCHEQSSYSPPYPSLEKLEIHMVENHCNVLEALSIYRCVPCIATLSTEITQLRHFNDKHNGGQNEQEKNVNWAKLNIYECLNESVMNLCKIPYIALCCGQCHDRSGFPQSFSSLDQLEMHIVEKHYNGLYLHKCWRCNARFPTQSLMLDHCKKEHVEVLDGKCLLQLVLAKIKILQDLNNSVFMSISASRDQNIEVIVLDNDDIHAVKQEVMLVGHNTTCTSPSNFSDATTVEAPFTYPLAAVHTTEPEAASKHTVLSITENNAEAQPVENPAMSSYPPEVSPKVPARAKAHVPGGSGAAKNVKKRTYSQCSMRADEKSTANTRPRRETKCPDHYGAFILEEPQLDYYIKMEPKKRRSNLEKFGRKSLTKKTVVNTNSNVKIINGEKKRTLSPEIGTDSNVKRKCPAKLSIRKKSTHESETSRKFCLRRKEHIPADGLVTTISKETIEMIELNSNIEMAVQENEAPFAIPPIKMPNKRHFF